jgi:hypothetical protein
MSDASSQAIRAAKVGPQLAKTGTSFQGIKHPTSPQRGLLDAAPSSFGIERAPKGREDLGLSQRCEV